MSEFVAISHGPSGPGQNATVNCRSRFSVDKVGLYFVVPRSFEEESGLQNESKFITAT